MPEARIFLGQIVKVIGIKGHVKILSHTEPPEGITSYPHLYDDKKRDFALGLVRRIKANLIEAQIKGISTRTEAETWVGTNIYIDRASLPSLEPDAFYYADLIGLTVEDETGHAYGHITAIPDYGAGAFLEIQTEAGKTITAFLTKDMKVLTGKVVVNQADVLA